MERRDALMLFGAVGGTLFRQPARAEGGDQRAPFVDVAAKYGLRGGWADDDDARIQAALDHEPVGARLVFTPGLYRITHPLLMSRLQHIDATGAVFRGEFADPDLDLLRIRITDAGGNRDVRGLTLKGGAWFLSRESFAGRHCLEVNGEVGRFLPVLGMRIEGAGFSGGSGQGLALYGEVGHSTIIGNQVDAILLSKTPDANKILGNLISGARPGVTVDLQPGAFCTAIEHNTIVCQNGALDLINGSEVKFRNNQCEQPPVQNAGEPSAHVVVRGRDYASYSVEISGNNFGAGRHLRASIYLQNARNSVVDGNTFMRSSSGIDVVESAQAKWTRIGPNNSARRERLEPNDSNRAIVVECNGVGAYGVYFEGQALGQALGWEMEDVSFFKDLSGVVRFTGRLKAKDSAGSRIGMLPQGFRPAADLSLPIVMGDRLAVIHVAAGGVLSLDSVQANMPVHLSALSFIAAPCEKCSASP